MWWLIGILFIFLLLFVIVNPNINPCPRCNAMKYDKGSCVRCGYSANTSEQEHITDDDIDVLNNFVKKQDRRKSAMREFKRRYAQEKKSQDKKQEEKYEEWFRKRFNK